MSKQTFEQFVRQRFGTLKAGSHSAGDGNACAYEALSAYEGRRWGDYPSGARSVDLRDLNDSNWPTDEDRTRCIIPVIETWRGSLDWPPEDLDVALACVYLDTVREVLPQAYGLSEDVQHACQTASTVEEARKAADRAGYYDDSENTATMARAVAFRLFTEDEDDLTILDVLQTASNIWVRHGRRSS